MGWEEALPFDGVIHSWKGARGVVQRGVSDHNHRSAVPGCVRAGMMDAYGFAQADSVWSGEGISPTIITDGNRIGHQINALEET